MSYLIKFSDFANKGLLTVNDSVTNTQTSLGFPGRNQRGYSSIIAENFLHLLENFSNSIPPSNPIEGQIWYDTSPGVEDLKVYDGTTWKSAGSIKKSNISPPGVLGDLWVDTDNQQLYLFNGASWILVGPSYSTGLRTGVQAETIIDSNDANHIILSNYIDDQVVSIYSLSTFIPKVTIIGFSTIKAGLNLSSTVFTDGNVNKFWGISEKAEALVVGGVTVPAANFLRSDLSNITNAGLTVRNNQGIATGNEGQLKLTVDSNQTGNIYHSTVDSAFEIRVNRNNEITTLFRADSNGRVGIGVNNTAPVADFDVKGTSRFTDTLIIESTQNTINDVTGALQVKGGANIQKDLILKGNSSISGQILIGSAGSSAGTIAILPREHNIFDIGYSNPNNPNDANTFRYVYASRFYGSLKGDVQGNVTGSANTAYSLQSSTVFNMTGDVSSTGFSFDGSAGGLTKTFQTSITSGLIDNKQEVQDVLDSDTLLIQRSGIGLKKMSRQTFFSGVPVVPIGAIFPFAGEILPQGYLWCDGSEKSNIIYEKLFQVIGYTYGDPVTLSGIATFRLPDLRGRFPLGRNNMDNGDSVNSGQGPIDSNTVSSSGVTQQTAGITGRLGGTESFTLNKANIPDHQHNFVGDNNTEFFATNNNTGIPADTGAFLGNGPSAEGNGQYINTTGSMIGHSNPTTPINVINPYMTINYIIYTGKIG